MRRLRRSWKRWQFERGWRRIYGRDDLITYKTDDQLRAEADRRPVGGRSLRSSRATT